MVCEFLPKPFKEKLVEMASVEDLVSVGYTYKSATNVKHHKIISDERCDALVKALGERALPVLREALHEFTSQVRALEEELGLPEATGDAQQPQLPEAVVDYMRRLEERLKRVEEYLAQSRPKWTEKDLDRIYYQIAGDTGLTMIKYLRQQMGMSLEEFMARFRDYIIQNYELHPGGDEGILINGTMHGVIRRKDFDPKRRRMYL